MTEEIVHSDIAILDLLRKCEAMTVTQLASALGVTATAVRQRLNRLRLQGFIGRESVPAGRGRPRHHYRLTAKGLRKAGANFADLAVALWEEIRAVTDRQVREGLLERIARRLAEHYEGQIEGSTVEQRMRSLVSMFEDRRIPFILEKENQLPVIKALACPYPGLAEKDRTICAMEELLFSQLLGENVQLSTCLLDEGSCCTFTLEQRPVETSHMTMLN